MTAEEYRNSLEKAKRLIPIIMPMPPKELDYLASYIVGYKNGYEDRNAV